jgi:hypothetical protein
MQLAPAVAERGARRCLASLVTKAGSAATAQRVRAKLEVRTRAVRGTLPLGVPCRTMRRVCAKLEERCGSARLANGCATVRFVFSQSATVCEAWFETHDAVCDIDLRLDAGPSAASSSRNMAA